MIPPSNSTRRDWVKQFVLGSAATLIGVGGSSRLLAEVTSTGPGQGVLRIKSAMFPALNLPGGSVQLKFIGYLKPLTLNRVTPTQFIALDSRCTHQSCTVNRFIGEEMTCPCHGSRYDIEGKVFRDANGVSTEPADSDIARFTTVYHEPTGIVSVTIPDLALHIKSISVHEQGPEDSVRLKLEFPVSYGAIYEIRHQTNLNSPFNLVSFATTPTGPANRTSIGPEDEGNFTAYVDAAGPSGFFAIGVRLTEVL